MPPNQEARSLAVFCDFENVALGVREAKYAQFDMEKVLERLLLKGSIVVKKAYCDWERYKEFKAAMHEAAFELIEIPHVRQSGKNSADIRMVVDALDLCYTKAHVDTFVIVSGDSDFSPLVSQAARERQDRDRRRREELDLRPADRQLRRVHLLRRPGARRRAEAPRGEEARRDAGAAPARTSDKKQEAFDLVLETLEALIAERGEDEKIWGSMVKQALKRRKPGFNESYYGFRAFSDLLEEAREARPDQARAGREVGRLPHPPGLDRRRPRSLPPRQEAARRHRPGPEGAVRRHQSGPLLRRHRPPLRAARQPLLAGAARRRVYAAPAASLGAAEPA